MAKNSISKQQYAKIKEAFESDDYEEANRLLEEYAGIEARPCTMYMYYDSENDYCGCSDDVSIDDVLRAAYLEVTDG